MLHVPHCVARCDNPRRSASLPASRRRALPVEYFLQQLINGLSLGAIYALIALGYTMVYGVLRFINFAHSDVFMVGAYVGYFLGQKLPKESIFGGVTALAASPSVQKPSGTQSPRTPHQARACGDSA